MTKKKYINVNVDDETRSITLVKDNKDFGYLVIDLNNINNVFHCYKKHLNIKELK